MKLLDIPKTISLNTYRNTHYFKLNALKQEFAWFVLEAMKNKREKPKTPVKLIFTFGGYRHRDIDGEIVNVKFTIDALVSLGILPDDSPEYVNEIVMKTEDSKRKTFDLQIESNDI